MGKRVTIKKAKPPQLQVGKLRHPGEAQTKMFAALGFLFFCTALILPSLLFRKKDMPTPVTVYYLIAWYAVGWAMTLLIAGGHRSKLTRKFPRSKVTGSAHQELRLQLNQLCRLLDIKRVPDTYVIDSTSVSAVVRGMGAPYMVLSSRMLQFLTESETTALLAVLLSHVKAGTVRWRSFVTTFREMPGITRLLCLPYYIASLILGPYMDFSQQTAEHISLLLLGGNHKLMITTIIKFAALGSESLTADQAHHLQEFLNKEGVEASAEDVERMYILNQMIREIPGLRERVESLAKLPADDNFQEQLAIMGERMNRLQTGVRV